MQSEDKNVRLVRSTGRWRKCGREYVDICAGKQEIGDNSKEEE